MIFATIIFTLYIAFYWKSGTKSISLTAYESKWSGAGFLIFMVTLGIIFAHEEGKIIYGYATFPIAGYFLAIAGLSFQHKAAKIKQVHHAVSGIAILFGFIALWNIWAVVIFAILIGIAYFVDRDRFLFHLEWIAFYDIIGFKIWNG